MLDIAAVLITLTALFSYINHRFIHLPTPIGVMAIALLLSLAMIAFGLANEGLINHARELVGAIDFDEVLLNGMLSFLLFAGALHVDLTALSDRKKTVGILATLGVIASTMIIGSVAWALFNGLLGLNVPFIYWLLLGALLSPTDPIAVLGIMKAAKAPQSLEIKIVGESLFNDGVAVVVFIILAAMATGAGDFTASAAVVLFLQETLGGALLGLIAGYIVYCMLRTVDNYNVEVLLTVALVLGGFTLAQRLHVSGPIAMVCCWFDYRQSGARVGNV